MLDKHEDCKISIQQRLQRIGYGDILKKSFHDMGIRAAWRFWQALPVMVLLLFFLPVHAGAIETVQPAQSEQVAGTPLAEENPDHWEKLASNHIEEVYIKPAPHEIDPNITGIQVKVVARSKELFDYAEGIAMADCDIREVFPVSGDIYDVNGKTIDLMHIPLLKGMVYVKAFPQEAYDSLVERLCARQPITKNQ